MNIQVRAQFFIYNILEKTLFDKNVANFCQLAITSVYKIAKFLSMLI